MRNLFLLAGLNLALAASVPYTKLPEKSCWLELTKEKGDQCFSAEPECTAKCKPGEPICHPAKCVDEVKKECKTVERDECGIEDVIDLVDNCDTTEEIEKCCWEDVEMCLPVTTVECNVKIVPQTVEVCEDQTKTECSEVEETECLDELTKKCEDKTSSRTEQKCGTKLERVCKNVPKTVVRPMNVLRKVKECKDVKEEQCMLMPVWKKVPTNSTECITGTENVCRVVDLPKDVEECTVQLVDHCKPVSKKHVRTVDEEVCKDELVDVVEEVCDDNKVNVDSYGPPKAPLLDSYGPPQAPLKPACREVARKKVENVCKTLPKQVVEWREEEVCVKVPQNTCKTVSRISPTKVCGLEQVEKCRWVVRNENKQVEERVCTFVDKKECSDVERWVVEDVEREEEEEKCSDQPKPFCQDIQVPFTEPVCKMVLVEVCKPIKVTKCKDVTENVCHDVTEEVEQESCKPVTRDGECKQVPTKVCKKEIVPLCTKQQVKVPKEVCKRVSEDICEDKTEKRCTPAQCDYNAPPVCQDDCVPQYMCKVCSR